MRSKAALLALPLDTRERHTVAASLLGSPESVLDVGGRPRSLEHFLPGAQIVTANVDRPADVLLQGDALPFLDRSFDAVTSLDVLEHLEPGRRRLHLEELARVASRSLVVSTPLGSKQHVESERALDGWYVELTGRPHPFLREHLERGLATEEELRGLVADLGFRFELLFHGDFREVNRIFRQQVLARRGRPGAAATYLLRRLGARTRVELSRTSTEWSNRAFLVGRS